MAKTLTQKGVEKIAPTSKRREIPDRLLPGLYLVVQPKPSGAKSWCVRYRFGGRTRKHTIGPLERYDLKQARDAGGEALRQAVKGTDPALEKKLARTTPETSDKIEDVLQQFIRRYARAKNSTWRETARYLGYKPDPDDDKELVPTGNGLAKRWKGRLIGSITKREVLVLIDKEMDAGHPIAANRTLGLVRKLFKWCRERGITDNNPTADIGKPAMETSRDRVLSDAELRLVWQATAKLEERHGGYWPFAVLVRELVLTGQRRDEVAQMRWPEVDHAKKLWTVPRERRKTKIAHEVPLSEPALAILATVPRIKSKPGYVLTTTGKTPISGFSRAKTQLDTTILESLREHHGANAKPLPGWTLHDLRRTLATGMQRLGVRLEVTEAVLGHVSGSRGGVVGVYQRHDWAAEKRTALDAWSRHVMAVVEGAAGGNVVPFAKP